MTPNLRTYLKFLSLSLALFNSACGWMEENENPPLLSERLAAKMSRTGGVRLSSGSFELKSLSCTEGKVRSDAEAKLKTDSHSIEIRDKKWVETLVDGQSKCQAQYESKITESVVGHIALKGETVTCSAECTTEECKAKVDSKVEFGYNYIFDGIKLKINFIKPTFCEANNSSGSWLFSKKKPV